MQQASRDRSFLGRLVGTAAGSAAPFESLEARSLLAVTALNPIADSVVQIDAAASAISIAGRYDNTELNGTIARFATDIGDINVLLYDQANPGVTRSTPLTVANFLRYVNDGRYEQTVFHRSVSGFVIQGGGFKRPIPTASHPSRSPPSHPSTTSRATPTRVARSRWPSWEINPTARRTSGSSTWATTPPTSTTRTADSPSLAA